MQIDAALTSAEVHDSDGTPRRLGEFLAGRPTVIAWVRHFG